MTVHGGQAASPWVLRWASLIGCGSRVLDLACGHGRHSRLLAGQGALVTALDRDRAALDGLADVKGVTTLAADVESGPWPFAAGAFDAVVVTNYLHRPLYQPLLAVVADGGVLIYETFMAGNEAYGRPSNPEFLLRPGELPEVLGPSWQVVAFEQGLIEGANPAVVQRICAVKGGGGVTRLA